MNLAKCPNCGKDLPNESNFCPYCMENLSDFEADTVPETTSVIKCPNCGKDLPSESSFCHYCMENLSDFEADTVPETTSVIKCPNCGKDLPGESSFCPYCMERLSAPVSVTVPSKKKKLSKKTVTIIIVAVVIIALLAGGIALFNHYKELEERKAAVNECVDDLINSFKATRKETKGPYGEVECRTSFDEDYYNCTIYVSNSDGYDFMEIECSFVENTNGIYEILSVYSTLDYTSYCKAFDESSIYSAATEVILPTYCLLEHRNAKLSSIASTRFCEILLLATVYDEHALSDTDTSEHTDGRDRYSTRALYGCNFVSTSFDYDKGIYECDCVGLGESEDDNSKNNTDDTKNTEKSDASENNVTENNSNSNSNLNNNSNNSINSNSNQGSSYDTDKILNAIGGTGGNSNSSTSSNSNQGSSYDTDKILNAIGGTGGNSNNSTSSNSNQGSHSDAGNSSGTGGGTGGNSNSTTSSNSNQGGNSNAGNSSSTGSGTGGSSNNTVTECYHSWIAKTKTVHHDEVGHYETVENERKVTKYKCPVCYKTFASLDEYYSHFDSSHKPSYSGDPVSMLRRQYTTVSDYETYTTNEWVVDREEYDETVITGYKCSICGKEKSD